MTPDRIAMLLRWCRGRELGIGRFSRALTVMSLDEPNLAVIQEEVYSRNSSAVAFQAVARAMAFGSSNLGGFDDIVDQLGPARVCKAALSASLISAVPEIQAVQVFDYVRFQKRCLFNAYFFETLCQRVDSELSKEAFVVGLLMDGSYLLMLEHFPSDIELSLFTRINNPSLSADQAENLYMGITNTQISSTIAEHAKLSKAASDGLLHRLDPSAYEGRFERAVDLCHFASVIADHAGYSIARGLPKTQMNTAALERLGFKKEITEHVNSAIQYSKEISDASVTNAIEAVRAVRRFSK